MVLTLMIPARHLFNLKHIITEAHIEAMCKILFGHRHDGWRCIRHRILHRLVLG